MAFAINKSDISLDKIEIIRKLLFLTPEVPINKYNKDFTPSSILFYRSENEKVHLPYLFSSSLFQIIPNIDIKYPTSNLQFTGSLRENQLVVIKEASEQLEKYGTTTLGLYPGFGKTILGAKLAADKKLLVVVLVHREILTIQWKKTFETFTNGNVWIVGEKNPPATCNVIICMDTRWEKIDPTLRDMVGFLIIDEAHAFCTPTHVGCLLAFHPKYIVIETATLERDDGLYSMIHAISGTHGVFRETDKPFEVIKINTNIKPVRKMNRMGGVDYTSLSKTIVLDERRNEIIVNLVINNPNNTILILTNLVEHVMLLHDLLQKRSVSCDYMCGSRKFYQDSRVLVATSSKVGTGFDQSTACPDYSGRRFDLLLVVFSIKKESILVQNVGRVFRSDYPTVMHFVDNDDIFKSHWYKCRKWYLKHNGNIKEHTVVIPEAKTVEEKTEEWVKETTKKLTLNIIK